LNTTTIIQTKIRELENKYCINILFACESGSRAWGFPSPDSDYDVRFIYAHPPDWYLSIHEKTDVIDLPINKELDINGWELRKSLRLLSKHNAVLFEWMQSPVIYSANEAFLSGFNQVAANCFSPIASMYHYLNMSKKYYDEYTGADQVKLKKYLYCLRTTLAGEWIGCYKTVPPMEIGKLLSLLKDKKELLTGIEKLIQLKATKDESYLHPHELDLEAYLEQSIKRCENIAQSLPAVKLDYEILDDFFKKTIKES
jgi:uncharacterized protein